MGRARSLVPAVVGITDVDQENRLDRPMELASCTPYRVVQAYCSYINVSFICMFMLVWAFPTVGTPSVPNCGTGIAAAVAVQTARETVDFRCFVRISQIYVSSARGGVIVYFCC